MREDSFKLRLDLPQEYIKTEKDWAEFRNFAEELGETFSSEVKINSIGGGGGLAYEIVVAGLTGGVAATLVNGIYQVIQSYLNKYQARELTFSKGDKKITLKGRSPKEELELLKALFPESLVEEWQGERYILAGFYDPDSTSRTIVESKGESGEQEPT